MRAENRLKWTLGWLLATGLLSGCTSSDPPWQLRVSDDHSWLLSVAGLADRVLAVGGQPGATPGATGSGLVLVVSDEPTSPPQRFSSPQPGLLWWAHSLATDSPGHGVAWLCGEGGSVVRYEEQGPNPPQLQAVPTATTATLYGIWAFSDTDVWAVGGSDGSPGVVLHGDRSGLAIDGSAPKVPVLYKLYASAPGELFAVGSFGTLLRRVSGRWQLDPSPSSDRLLTVWGSGPSAVWAVGGLGSAALLSFDGQSWMLDGATAGLAALSGLYVDGSELLVVGQRGLIAHRAVGSGALTVDAVPTQLDLHGALLRGRARYAVGGNLSQYGLQPPQGVLLQQGSY